MVQAIEVLLLFYLSGLALSIYLLFARRTVDVFLVAGCSAVLFALPLFLQIPLEGPPGWPSKHAEPEIYLAFGSLYLMLFGGAVVKDRLFRMDLARSNHEPSAVQIGIGCILMITWVVVAIWNVYLYGFELLLFTSKRNLMDSSGFMLVLFLWLSVLIGVWCFYYCRLGGKIVGCIVIFCTLIIGFRAPVVISCLSLVLLYGRDYGPISILRRFPLLAPLLVVGSIFAVSMMKPIYGHFKSGGVSGIIEGVTTRDLGDLAFAGMEFMNTQYIFNEILLREYTTDGGHILRGPLSIIPVPRKLYTTPSSEFNELFQVDLFPGHESGMAYNPFAEFYAAGGMLGVYVFNLFLVAGLFIVNAVIWRSGSWSVLWAISGALLAFYVHRSSVPVLFGLFRNIFWPFLCAWIVSIFIFYASGADRRSRRSLLINCGLGK